MHVTWPLVTQRLSQVTRRLSVVPPATIINGSTSTLGTSHQRLSVSERHRMRSAQATPEVIGEHVSPSFLHQTRLQKNTTFVGLHHG